MNLEKVKEIWKELQRIANVHNYREFEVAFLISERLDNVINDDEQITDDLVKKVYDISKYEDTLLNDCVNEKLDNLAQEIEENS